MENLEQQDLNEDLESKDLNEEEEGYTPRSALIEEANLLGITYARNISNDALANKIQLHKAQLDAERVKNGRSGVVHLQRVDDRVLSAKDKALALVRFKLIVQDPSKMHLTGIIVSAGNTNMPAVTRMIPFGVESWHAERIVIEHLKNMKYTHFKVKNDMADHSEPKILPCFQVIELPPLTEKELKELADHQQATGTGITDTKGLK